MCNIDVLIWSRMGSRAFEMSNDRSLRDPTTSKTWSSSAIIRRCVAAQMPMSETLSCLYTNSVLEELIRWNGNTKGKLTSRLCSTSCLSIDHIALWEEAEVFLPPTDAHQCFLTHFRLSSVLELEDVRMGVGYAIRYPINLQLIARSVGENRILPCIEVPHSYEYTLTIWWSCQVN